MNREELIRMAREAGIPFNKWGLIGCLSCEVDIDENLERFAALVAEYERERCAQICDFEVARLSAIDEPRPALSAGICAAIIRAREEK